MKKLALSIVSFFVIVCISNSCIKDKFDLDRWDKEINYNGEFAIPIIKGEISFAQALDLIGDNDYFEVNSEGFMSLIYRTEVRSDQLYGELNFPDLQYEKSISVGDFQIYNGNINFEETYNVSFANNALDAEIVSAMLDSANLTITTNSTIEYPLYVEVTLPSVTKNGNPLSFSFNFNHTGINDNSKNLGGYKIDFTQTPAKYNEIPIMVKAVINSLSVPVTGTIDLKVGISEIKYGNLIGYLGQHVMMYDEDELEISLFNSEKINIDKFKFEAPKFSMYYENSYGIPSMFYFEELFANYASSSIDHNILGLQDIPVEANPYYIAHSNSLGSGKKDSLKISNSDISNFISEKPTNVKLKIIIKTNPNEKKHDNFIVRDSKIKADIVVELPLWGYLHNFYVTDTMDLDLSDIFKNKNPLKRAILRVEINNGFPIEALGQLYFADENYNILDSVFASHDERIFSAANVDVNGKVISASKKITKIECDLDKLNRLKNAKYMIYNVSANTTNSDTETAIKIYKEYKMSFNLGAEVEFDVSGSIDSLNNF
jgi:hypothetical protein